MNNDNNNQSGNSRTTFNAYNEQKNSAKNAMLGKGLDVASKFVPGGAVAKKAINTVAKNPMANAALQNAISRNKAAEDTEGEEPKSSPVNDLARAGVDTAKETAKVAAKRAVKSFVIAHLPVIIGIIVGFVVVLFLVLLITVGIQYADQLADKVIYTKESTLNFATGNGFKDNIELIQDRINDAYKDFSGIDKGILYAVVNNSAFVSTSVYEESSVDSSKETAFDAAKNFLVDKYSIHSFHTMKLDMLGSTGKAGSIIYSLMGEKIEVECVDPDNYSVKNNVVALSKYLYNGLLTAKDVTITQTGESLTFLYGAGELKFVDNVISYANQGANYFETNYNELVNLIDKLPANAIRNDWEYVKQKSNECATKYATKADGTYKVDPKTGSYMTMKAQYKTVKDNDYKQFYNYITRVYTPTMYNSIWNSLNDEEKVNLAYETWEDIVASRNDFYSTNGISNTLTYRFDDDGNIVVTADISYAGFNMGTVPTSEAAQAALSWKQGAGPWANNPMADPPIYTCGQNDNLLCSIGMVGCFVTSVSKLIAISGTQILTDTFDPGMFVDTLIHSNPPGLIDNMFYARGWESIAPNFKKVDWVGLDNRSFSANSGFISDYVKSSLASAGYVGTGYYYVFLVNYGAGHTHYIAIVGENDNGELLVSDPGGGPTTPYSIEEVGNYYSSAKIGGISVYYASDVSSSSMSSTGGQQ